jgi:hypothetical protein
MWVFDFVAIIERTGRERESGKFACIEWKMNSTLTALQRHIFMPLSLNNLNKFISNILALLFTVPSHTLAILRSLSLARSQLFSSGGGCGGKRAAKNYFFKFNFENFILIFFLQSLLKFRSFQPLLDALMKSFSFGMV